MIQSFKSYITEILTTRRNALIFSTGIFIPIMPNTMARIYGSTIYGKYWHYTDMHGVKELIKLQKTHTSISATEYAPWTSDGHKMFIRGVATRGGVAVLLIGRAMASHWNDLYTIPDEHGIRWLKLLRGPMELPEHIVEEFANIRYPLMKKYEIEASSPYNDGWAEIPELLPQEDIDALVHEYINRCEDLILKYKNALDDYFHRLPHSRGYDAFEVVLTNFKVLGAATTNTRLWEASDEMRADALTASRTSDFPFRTFSRMEDSKPFFIGGQHSAGKDVAEFLSSTADLLSKLTEAIDPARARVWIMKDGRVTSKISQEKFKRHTLQPGESYDFSEFKLKSAPTGPQQLDFLKDIK